MNEISRLTPQNLAQMTPKERRKALQERTKQSGKDWLKKNCPNNNIEETTLTSFQDLMENLKRTFKP